MSKRIFTILSLIASLSFLASTIEGARYQNISRRPLISPAGTAEPNDTVDFDYFFFGYDTLLWELIDYKNGKEFVEVSKILNLTTGDYDTTDIGTGFYGNIDIIASDSIAIFLNDTSETPIKTANYFYIEAKNDIARVIINCLSATATIEVHIENEE